VYTYYKYNNLNTSIDRVEDETKELDDTNIPITATMTATGSRAEGGADNKETGDGSSSLNTGVLYATAQLVGGGDHSGLETGDIMVVAATIDGFNGVEEVGLEGNQSRSSGDTGGRHLSRMLVAYQT
jgi:hypothetical protein